MAATTNSAALQKVTDLEKSSAGTDWLNVKKGDIVGGLKDRLPNPDHIDTSQLNLCGPGLFFYFLDQDKPVTYAEIVIDLWRSNTAVLGTRRITAPYDLRISPITSGVDPVDWVPMTSLRTDENFVLTANDGVGLDSLSMPSAITKWLGQAGYTDLQNETNVVWTKGVDNIKKASEFLGKGYRVGLFINANMLYAAKQANRSMTPDHWVSLEKAFQVDDKGNASMTVWGWKQMYKLPVSGTLTADVLLKNYYGFVAAKPPASP